jgi:hypothetical protein
VLHDNYVIWNLTYIFQKPIILSFVKRILYIYVWVIKRRTSFVSVYFKGRFSERYAVRKSKMVSNRRRYNHEIDKEFDSPNALNVTKTSKLRYAGHMIRRSEDLPQKALFRAKPNGRRNQGRPKSRWADWVNSDSLALGVSNRQSWRDLQQALTRYWF